MQCLESLSACGTAVEELPESIGLLSTLQVLKLGSCKKIRNLPSSIWNLTSLAELFLLQEVKINLPDMVKDTKLKSLEMTCDVSLWLPVILSLSSLESLYLHCESQSFSPNEPYSLSKLSNLRELTLYNKIRHECSFPELPLNLTKLRIYNYKTLEMLPDLSSLKQLKSLRLWSCISLQSIPPLPPHLEELELEECTSLKDLPDLSTLKELRTLRKRKCIKLKSNILKQSFLQVGKHDFVANKNKDVAECFSYESSGNTLSFTIPPNSNSGDNFFDLRLWYAYTYNGPLSPHMRTVITNRTKDIKMDYPICLWDNTTVEYLSMESGDRIKISVYSSKEGKVTKCRAYVMPRNPR